MAATAIEPEETAAELPVPPGRPSVADCSTTIWEGAGRLPLPRDQAGVPSYAEKILPGELEIHWEEPADRIHRVVRVGRAWTTFRGRRLGVVAAARVPEEGGRAAPVGGPGRWREPTSSPGTGRGSSGHRAPRGEAGHGCRRVDPGRAARSR